EFSDQQSITESIFEMVASAPAFAPSPGTSPLPSPDPLRADSRYNATIPVLLQSTFEMPQFKGHLNAFRNISSVAQPPGAPACAGSPPFPAACLDASDAGRKLYDRVATNSLTTLQYTFDQLRGGSTSTDANIVTFTAPGVIRRRIYTT